MTEPPLHFIDSSVDGTEVDFIPSCMEPVVPPVADPLSLAIVLS